MFLTILSITFTRSYSRPDSTAIDSAKCTCIENWRLRLAAQATVEARALRKANDNLQSRLSDFGNAIIEKDLAIAKKDQALAAKDEVISQQGIALELGAHEARIWENRAKKYRSQRNVGGLIIVGIIAILAF